MSPRHIIFAIIVAIVILIIALSYCYVLWVKTFLRHARGYWICDPTFAESAEVGTMLMFLSRDCGYLIIDEDVNTKFDIKYGIGNVSADMSTYSVPATVDFAEECTIPNKLTFEINMIDARLRIIGRDEEGEKTIYGVFWKDPEISYMYRD